MKRILCILTMTLACVLIFAGCQCEHKWDPATCVDPKICQSCGVSDGEPLGHSWKPATCAAPKTCEVCKQTEGKALAHTWVDADCDSPKTCSVCAAVNGEARGHRWMAATCDTPKTCSVCNLTEGEALGHKWTAATTENPKTCATCGKTEGSAIKTDDSPIQPEDSATQPEDSAIQPENSPIQTDPRFNPDTCKDLFGSWESATEYTAADLGLTNQSGSYTEVTVYTFRNDGTMSISHEIENIDSVKKLMIAGITESIYADYDSKEAADQYMQAHYGMRVEEYAVSYTEAYLKNIQATVIEGVYYVSDDRLYLSDSWTTDMECYDFFIENNQLRLIDPDGDYLDLTRR